MGKPRNNKSLVHSNSEISQTNVVKFLDHDSILLLPGKDYSSYPVLYTFGPLSGSSFLFHERYQVFAGERFSQPVSACRSLDV